jgi:hypothetical protein
MSPRLAALTLATLSLTACTEHTNCRDIHRTPITNGSGILKLCVTATQCREDTMAQLISAALCTDPARGDAAKCEPGECSGSGHCLGVVDSSGLVATNCKWDRDNPCSAPPSTNPCTCDWKIPNGASLSCGCDCK